MTSAQKFFQLMKTIFTGIWAIQGLINELDAVVIQKFSQNWLNKETVVKAAIIHHDTIVALKKDTSVRPLNFNSIFKK